MATAKKVAAKHAAKGLKQDRALLAGQQPHETAYESKKTGTSTAAVKSAVKTVGPSRKEVEKKLSK